MATKDWKKVKENKYLIDYERKDGTKGWAIITKGIPSVGWRVSVYGKYAKYFKTKSQALAYAKAYMRKH